MTHIIDRRLNGKKKSIINRQRFIRRFKSQIRKAASEAISGRSISDTTSGETVSIPTRDISEPVFQHGTRGQRTRVYPGNKDFVSGDEIPRPDGGGGAGGNASGAGDQAGTEDDFAFELSRDEFLDCFFEDLELPDLVKTDIKQAVEFHHVRSGYTRDGVPANINIVRSLRGALARRIALRGPYIKRLQEAELELEELRSKGLGMGPRANELEAEITRLKARIKAIPFIDTFDLRYNNHSPQPQPSTQAVMFCLMDVSGSMSEYRKNIAKRFFILLHLFLLRAYDRIDIVFIRHHVNAAEVDEETFFHSRESGGTVVSSALTLMKEIIDERYPTSSWNIYGAQASDGENWGGDSHQCRELLSEHILPRSQYFAYVEVTEVGRYELWQEYEKLASHCENFAMRQLKEPADIYPVFRNLLVRRT